jgi:hypothetical protein
MHYWVVVNAPDPFEEPDWTPEDAVKMIVGELGSLPPQWLFNRRGQGLRPPGFDRVKPGDGVLLYNGASYGPPESAFLAYATAKGAEPVPEERRFRILLRKPMGRLEPVTLDSLRSSKQARVSKLGFGEMYKARHGPLNDLGAYPGSSSSAPGRAETRWTVIVSAGTGALEL